MRGPRSGAGMVVSASAVRASATPHPSDDQTFVAISDPSDASRPRLLDFEIITHTRLLSSNDLASDSRVKHGWHPGNATIRSGL